MAVCFDGCSGIVYQDGNGCFAHDQVSFYLRVQPISESCNAYIVLVWEICFESLELCLVSCCRSVALLDLLEFLECYFFCIYLAKIMLHVSLQRFPC